jgi:hypothetical protein
MPDSEQPPFRGFYPPEYTMVPNDLLDDLLPSLSGAELKVLLYIVRRTLGFHRNAATISIAQIRTGLRRRDGTALDRGTGLGRTAVTDALRSLQERGMIVAHHNESEEYGTRPTIYALRFAEGASAPADGGVHPSEGGASAGAGSLPIEERKSGERKSDEPGNEKTEEAHRLWAEALEVIRATFQAGHLADFDATEGLHLEGNTLVVAGPRALNQKWARYLHGVLRRPVRFEPS